jgi:RNA polymerase sigma-70 factor (ECF subfamily)
MLPDDSLTIAHATRGGCSGVSPTSELQHSRWFAEEVHPHESSLRAYLRDAFPVVRDVDDVVQESFLRTWRARTSQPIRSARAFLFQVARRVALDLVRRDRRAPCTTVRDLAALPVLESGLNAAEAAGMQEKLYLVADGVEALPKRCRQIVILRKLQGIPQKEVAARLGLSEKTVEAQLSRGIARLEDFLRRRGVSGWYRDE